MTNATYFGGENLLMGMTAALARRDIPREIQESLTCKRALSDSSVKSQADQNQKQVAIGTRCLGHMIRRCAMGEADREAITPVNPCPAPHSQ